MLILKIPLSAGALNKKKGLERGPDRIVEHLKDFYLSERGVLPLFNIRGVSVDNNNLEEAHALIQAEVENINDYALLLGGDHSLTYPAFKAFAKHNPGAGIVVFDAHPDLERSHTPPTHEDYLRLLIEEEILDKDKLILVGVRNMSKDEKKFIDDNKIKNYSMRSISFDILREVADSIMSVARHWPKVYLSIDIDVLDPAFAPGTSYPEPGGVTTRELLYLVQRLKMLRNLGMVDMVEVNPDKDVNDITSRTAAKIVVELG